MEALFRAVGIYSSIGQLYEPVDMDTLLYYKEAKDGQILEEGITEAGSLSSFIAAGTAYATHGVNTIPFFIYYSMFGFQRVGDFIWAAADSRTRGFLLGGTAGRTTLAGEGLQHQDGNSHTIALTVPNCKAYDPAYAFELATIIRSGLKRMFEDEEDILFYITLYNHNYPMPGRVEGAEEGILKGLYRFREAAKSKKKRTPIRLFGSGPLMREALKAQEMLAEHGVAADVYSATSYQQLERDARTVERWNRLHPDEPPKTTYLASFLAEGEGPIVAVSDFLKGVPGLIGRFVDVPFVPLGTDGFGRSDTRPTLRRHFEIDAEHITAAALSTLAGAGSFDAKKARAVIQSLGLDPEATDPYFA
jgi:pyruvate dehydrogenase E1 component